MNDSLKFVESYSASPKEVWKAITDKVQMKQWYFDSYDFKLKVDTIFNFDGQGNDNKIYQHRCKIKEIIPYKKLQHTWTYPNHSKGESILTWEIIPRGSKTEVILTHEGIENFADAGKDFTNENFKAGWKEILGQSLKQFLKNRTQEK